MRVTMSLGKVYMRSTLLTHLANTCKPKTGSPMVNENSWRLDTIILLYARDTHLQLSAHMTAFKEGLIWLFSG